jgi:hypothetical protein
MSDNTIIQDGNFWRPVPIKSARISYPIANFQALKIYSQEFVQNVRDYTPAQLGLPHPTYSDGVLVEEKGFKNIGAGLFTFTRTFCTVPDSGFIRPTLASFSFPGRREQWPKYEFSEQFGTGYRKKEFEDKILQDKRTYTVAAKEFISFHNLAASKTTTTEIEPGITIDSTTYADGYDFDDITIKSPFVIIENGWKKMKELEPNSESDEIHTTEETLPPFETEFLSATSSPSITEYASSVSSGDYIQIQNTKIEQLIGPIYQSINLQVVAQ